MVNVHLMTPLTRAASFDHLVGVGEQQWRYGKAERSSGLEIHDELKSCRLFDGEFCRCGPLEDFVDKHGGAAKAHSKIRAVGHKATGLGFLAQSAHQRNPERLLR